MKDGLLNGLCTTYYESGNLMNILTYNDSIPIGDAIEYYDLPGNRVKYTLNYSKVDGKKWVNWKLKYDTAGNVIKSTTVIENIISPKTIKIGDSLKIEFHLQYPQYPKTKVYYGDYDDDFNLIDTSSIKSSYGSKNAVAIYVRPRRIGKDTVRGILENYKILDSLKNGLTKTEGKMIYWSHQYDVVK